MKLQVRFSFKLISNPPSLGRLALLFIKTCKTLDTAVCTFITSLLSGHQSLPTAANSTRSKAFSGVYSSAYAFPTELAEDEQNKKH